jgi:hypothetical protein
MWKPAYMFRLLRPSSVRNSTNKNTTMPIYATDKLLHCTSVTYIAIIVFFSVQYLRQDGRKRPKHVEDYHKFSYYCTLSIVHSLEYIGCLVLLHGT